jgi:hypothetical protein
MPVADSSTIVIDDQPPQRTRCQQCGASTHPHAKFCWMCGVPVKPPTTAHGESTSHATTTKDAAATHENSFTIWLTAWLALPVVIAIVYGIARIEPGYAVLAGPALVIATVVTLIRGTIRASRAKAGKGQAPGVGSSLAVWLVTAATTFAATAAILAVIAAVLIISFFIAFIRCLQGLN